MWRNITFTVVLILSAGCAADRHAQQLASRVLQETIKYEAEVDKKVAAENAFYVDQRELIRFALGGNSAITDPKADKVTPIEKTLIYGRIRTNAERGARLVADEILASDPPKITARVIEYIDVGLKEDQAFYLGVLERQRQLTVDLLTKLEKLEQQKARLRNVRNYLTTLATQPSISVQLTEIVEIGKAVAEQLKKGKQDK
jgi:hypothetical protein